jgi:hypothetical protein
MGTTLSLLSPASACAASGARLSYAELRNVSGDRALRLRATHEDELALMLDPLSTVALGAAIGVSDSVFDSNDEPAGGGASVVAAAGGASEVVAGGSVVLGGAVVPAGSIVPGGSVLLGGADGAGDEASDTAAYAHASSTASAKLINAPTG